ncbi:unnamed protein product [Dovyalis caffra]|uniref:Sigma factor n=1 Tax=Dovyalis caffra TaxID=77055 RepID=A0AAV1SK03_9ROSI|nr:unnamed protein product [Dovyalis caffra]
MGVGFRLTPKWGSPMQSRSVTNSTSRFSSFAGDFISSSLLFHSRGRDASVNQARLSFLSVVYEEGDIPNKYSFKNFACSAAQHVENDCLQMEGLKMNGDKRSHVGINNMMDDDKVSAEEDTSSSHMCRERKTSRFSLLLDNLDALEKSVADSDALKLERDILLQLERLGALEFFKACLSRTLQTPNVWDLSAVPIEPIGESKTDGTLDDHIGKIVVRTGKTEERKWRRERGRKTVQNKLQKPTYLSPPSKTVQNNLQLPTIGRKTSSSRSKRLTIARNEAEMSSGVKVVGISTTNVVSDLERIIPTLEEETGQVVSLSCWAEAAGLDKKVLQQQLQFGWYCREELLRSTRSLVIYIARNYRGMGIAMEDLLQPMITLHQMLQWIFFQIQIKIEDCAIRAAARKSIRQLISDLYSNTLDGDASLNKESSLLKGWDLAKECGLSLPDDPVLIIFLVVCCAAVQIFLEVFLCTAADSGLCHYAYFILLWWLKFANVKSNPIIAGNLGVLQGAERFDPTRGYRFSTYVQYWIRKSILKIVERHARGIQVPYALSRATNKIQKARKALSNSHGKYPDDSEIAKFTGLSLAKIESAKKCLRVVASLDQRIGEGLYAKCSEFISDTSIQNPEEAVMRQHMRKEIYDLLRGLDSRERQVMFLRYGFKDHQPKSLAEIGRLFHVSKECVRKIEKKVMMRLRDEGTHRNLNHYMNL